MRFYRNAFFLILLLSCIGIVKHARAQQNPAQAAQAYGISAKRPVLGAACKVCPWGALAEVVKQALEPYGYDVQICYNCSLADAPRIVAAAKVPTPVEPWYKNYPFIPPIQMPPPPNAPVDFGVTNAQSVWYAYHGNHGYTGEGERKNLRLLANIQSPSYLIVAVKSDLGITDLSQVKAKRWPVRILGGANGEGAAVLAYYGLTKDAIESAGGHVGNGQIPDDRKDFDIIVATGTLGNAPEYNVWYEVSQKYDLTYLQLPDDLLDKLAKDYDMQRGAIPDGLLRGIDHPIPTVVRSGTVIYGRADMPDDFAYTVAKAMDEHQDLLQWSHLNFSYNLHTVWKDNDVPLHPAAARYYHERAYMK